MLCEGEEVALTQIDDRALPLVDMNTQQLREEEEIFFEDQESKRRAFDAPKEPLPPQMYLDAKG